MSPINRNTLGLLVNTRLAGYAALAGAALAAPAVANAAIIYSGPISIPITANIDGLYINFVTGANANATVAGWDFNPYSSSGAATGPLSFFTSAVAGHVNNVVGVGTIATALTAGTLIGPASTYATTGIVNTTGTAFQTTQNIAYVGIRFQNEANANLVTYGWALLSTSATNAGFPATLIGYAYEDSGAGILAGAVPEPSTAALLGVMAAGAFGVRAWRKRKAA
jgi:hypothetical protein